MIQEYLLNDLSEKDSIKKFKVKGVKKKLFFFNDKNCCYIQFSVDGENEDAAKLLSSIDESIQNKYNVTVLNNGCSAYFNKRLYPLVNDFECKLRKLLYLSSASNPAEKSTSNITNLELQDFGQIFSMLFIDTAFMGKVKEDIKSRNKDYFSKAEIVSAIESMDENTLWDSLIGEHKVPTLRTKFNDIRHYRNDVMHSHYISYKKYKDALHLYKLINEELTVAIKDIETTESNSPQSQSFNKTLESALQIQKQIAALSKAIAFNSDYYQGYYFLHEQLSQISKMIANNPTIIQKQIEALKAFTIPEINISPDVLKAFGYLSSLNPTDNPHKKDDDKDENKSTDNSSN